MLACESEVEGTMREMARRVEGEELELLIEFRICKIKNNNSKKMFNKIDFSV